jgi:hypothetical protein
MSRPLASEFLLNRGYCCGNKCKNCPYTPKHKKVMWVDIIKLLVDVTGKKQELEQAKRARLSEVFLEISKLLEETAEELGNNNYPIGKCFAMTTLADELVTMLKDKMSDEEWHNLAGMLYQSCKVEREYADRKNPETINSLKEAAGHFYAKSLIFKL